jgi:hypothetical protein
MLPGQDPTDDGRTTAAERAADQAGRAPAGDQNAQDGLLDYLLGGNG